MNILSKTEDKLRSLLSDALSAAFGCEAPDFLIEVPKDTANGDYSTNMAMLLSRSLKKAPRDIAAEIVKNIATDDMVERVDIAGPGFINFYLNTSYIYDVLKEIEDKGSEYGHIDVGAGKTVNVEYVSANPTGPMHMGNARGGAIGDCLAAVLSAAGSTTSITNSVCTTSLSSITGAAHTASAIAVTVFSAAFSIRS